MPHDLPRFRLSSTSAIGILALLIVLSACDSGSAPPSVPPPTLGDVPQSGMVTPADEIAGSARVQYEPAGEILAQARAAFEAIESYHYTLDLSGWQERDDGERSESHMQATGVWVALGDYRMEMTGDHDPSEILPSQGLSVDGRYYQFTEPDGWREMQHPPTGAPPASLITSQGEWALVDDDASLDGAAVYHLRNTWTNVPQLSNDRIATVQSTHDLYLATSTMLPLRLDARLETRVILTTRDMLRIAERGETVYTYDFSGYNTPVNIDLPEDRVDLPPRPDAPPISWGPISWGPPDQVGMTWVDLPLQVVPDTPFEGESWPPFMMVYELRRWPSTTHVLYWRNERDWRDEVISGPEAQEERVGSWREFREGALTGYDAITGQTHSRETDGIALSPVGQVMHQAMLYSGEEDGVESQQIIHDGTEVCHLDQCSTSVEAIHLDEGAHGVFTLDGIPLDTPAFRVILLHLPGQTE